VASRLLITGRLDKEVYSAMFKVPSEDGSLHTHVVRFLGTELEPAIDKIAEIVGESGVSYEAFEAIISDVESMVKEGDDE